MDFEKRFAKVILDAQDIREDSYDQEAANDAISESLSTDFKQFYRKSDYEAAEEAVKNAGLNSQMAQPIYLLIKYIWNDIQDWAKKSQNNQEG